MLPRGRWAHFRRRTAQRSDEVIWAEKWAAKRALFPFPSQDVLESDAIVMNKFGTVLIAWLVAVAAKRQVILCYFRLKGLHY